MHFFWEHVHHVIERRFLATLYARSNRLAGGIANGLCVDVDVLDLEMAGNVIFDIGGRGFVGGPVRKGAFGLEAAAIAEVEGVGRGAEVGAVDKDFAVDVPARTEVMESVGELNLGGSRVRGW